MASKDTEEAVKEVTEGSDVIEAESDGENSDNFEDASDGGGTHDFDRPEEWGDCSDRVGESADNVDNSAEEEDKDSSGAVRGCNTSTCLLGPPRGFGSLFVVDFVTDCQRWQNLHISSSLP